MLQTPVAASVGGCAGQGRAMCAGVRVCFCVYARECTPECARMCVQMSVSAARVCARERAHVLSVACGTSAAVNPQLQLTLRVSTSSANDPGSSFFCSAFQQFCFYLVSSQVGQQEKNK